MVWRDFCGESKCLIVCALTIAVMLTSGWQAQAQTDELSEKLLRIEQEIAAGNLIDSVTFLKYDTLRTYLSVKNRTMCRFTK
jgi:hypothetical protein